MYSYKVRHTREPKEKHFAIYSFVFTAHRDQIAVYSEYTLKPYVYLVGRGLGTAWDRGPDR